MTRTARIKVWLGVMGAVLGAYAAWQKIEENHWLLDLNRPFLQVTKITAGPKDSIGLRSLLLIVDNSGHVEAVNVTVTTTDIFGTHSARLVRIAAKGSGTVSLQPVSDSSVYRGTLNYANGVNGDQYRTEDWCFTENKAEAILADANHSKMSLNPCSVPR